MARQTTVLLTSTPGSVSEARAFVRDGLRDWGLGELTDTVALLTSELATNAVLHARSDYRLALRCEHDVVRVTVSDGSRTGPRRRSHAVHAGTGRGLALVETLAERWGTDGPGDGFAKHIWFEVATDPSARSALEEGALYGEDWLAMVDEL